jgi:hypothetical protein
MWMSLRLRCFSKYDGPDLQNAVANDARDNATAIQMRLERE